MTEERMKILESFGDGDMQDAISEVRRWKAVSSELAIALKECLRLTNENMPYEERRAKVVLYENFVRSVSCCAGS